MDCCSGQAQSAGKYELAAEQYLSEAYEASAHTERGLFEHYNAKDANENFAIAMIAPFAMFLGGLRGLSFQAEQSVLATYDSVDTGVRDVLPIRKFGLASGTQCYVAVSEPGTATDLALSFTNAVIQTIGAGGAWTWSLHNKGGSRDIEQFYASQIGNHYFLMCNDQQAFIQTYKWLSSSQALPPTHSDEAGLESVRTHRYWIIKKRVKHSEAPAFVLYSDIEDNMAYFEAWLSKEKGTTAQSNSLPNDERMQYVRVRPGVYQSSISLDPRGPTLDRLYTALGYLDFKINI